jgi:hypothetical protein
VPQIALRISPNGPLLDISVGVSAPRRVVLIANQGAAPSRIPGRFLIDTGASHSVVDTAIITALGLRPTSLLAVQTASTAGTPQQVPQYDVSLVLLMPPGGRMFNALPVFAMTLRPQGIDGLLGRDVLAECQLTYSGPNQFFLLWA